MIPHQSPPPKVCSSNSHRGVFCGSLSDDLLGTPISVRPRIYMRSETGELTADDAISTPRPSTIPRHDLSTASPDCRSIRRKVGVCLGRQSVMAVDRSCVGLWKCPDLCRGEAPGAGSQIEVWNSFDDAAAKGMAWAPGFCTVRRPAASARQRPGKAREGLLAPSALGDALCCVRSFLFLVRPGAPRS